MAIQDKIYELQTGAAQPHIYSKNLQNIKIPIPPLERQKEIVEYCEYNDLLIKQLEKEIENNKTQARLFLEQVIKTKHQEDDDEETVILSDEDLIDYNLEENKERDLERELNNKTELELKQKCVDLQIRYTTSATKSELINLILANLITKS